MECDVIVFISFSNVAKVKFFLIRNEKFCRDASMIPMKINTH